MLRTIIEKECRLTVMMFKFTVGSLLLVVLMASSALVLTEHWKKRVDNYSAHCEEFGQELKRAKRYRDVILRFQRRPQLLSLLNSGFAKSSNWTIELHGKYDVPRIRGGAIDNAYLRTFIPADYSRLVIIVMSLLALVLSYDAINGDRSQGTLQLSLVNSVSRATILMGKYLGILLSVMLPFTAATLIWLIILLLRVNRPMEVEMGVRIGIAFILSLLYVSVFIWLGLFTSILIARPGTSLTVALLIWTLAIVLYPTSVAKVIELRSNRNWGWELRFRTTTDYPDERTRDRVEAVHWESLQRAAARYHFAQWLLRLTPQAPYDYATAALARTDVHAYLTWLSAAHLTDEFLRRWQNEKIRAYPDREIVATNLAEPLDLTGLPTLVEPNEALLATLRRIAWDGMLLILYNVILWLIAYFTFTRSDVRP